MAPQNQDQTTYDALRESIRKVLNDVLTRQHIDQSEQSGTFCHLAHQELGKLGLLGPMLPSEFGGADDMYAQMIVAEEMGYLCAGFALSSLVSIGLFGANVSRHGSEKQKKKYLPDIVSGQKIGCWALTEPSNGSDAVGIKTTCQKRGEIYVINGTKTFISNAPIADYFLVIARDADNSSSKKGIEGGIAFILERGIAGLKTGQPLKKMGHRSSPTGEIFLENVIVPAEAVLGRPGMAFFDMKHSLDIERVIFSGIALGMMRACLDKSIRYVRERTQFGKSIGDYQMIQDKIARMAMLADCSKVYLYHALDQLIDGKDMNKQAAMAKLFVAESCKEIADHAVQCHGGYGYMEEYEVERFSRDAKLFEIGAGTSEIQKLIIAKQVLKM